MTEFEIGLHGEKAEEILVSLDRLVQESGLEHAIQKVIVTPDFAEAVKASLPEEKGESYDPVHDYGVAMGKTIPLFIDGHLQYVIVFDTRVFEGEGVSRLIAMRYYVIHELSHVKNGLVRHESTGWDPTTDRHEGEFLLENAWSIWEEYRAERTAAEIILDAVKAAAQGAEAEITPSFTLDFVEDVLRRLDEFGPILSEALVNYHGKETEIQEFSFLITSRLASIAILLAYVFALDSVSEQIKRGIARILENSNFRKYFSRGWGIIVENLEEMYADKSNYRENILRKIGSGYEQILRDCGLQITPIPSGYYVRVLS